MLGYIGIREIVSVLLSSMFDGSQTGNLISTHAKQVNYW